MSDVKQCGGIIARQEKLTSTAVFPHPAPHPFQSLIRMIGGRLSGNEAECKSINESVMQRGTRIYLWPKCSPSTPLRATSSALERCIWGAISKTLLACILATLGRVGFARGGKLLPFLFTASSWNPQNFHNQPVLPIERPMPNSRARFHGPRRPRRYEGGTRH